MLLQTMVQCEHHVVVTLRNRNREAYHVDMFHMRLQCFLLSHITVDGSNLIKLCHGSFGFQGDYRLALFILSFLLNLS
jgi:hypothetical protein